MWSAAGVNKHNFPTTAYLKMQFFHLQIYTVRNRTNIWNAECWCLPEWKNCHKY